MKYTLNSQEYNDIFKTAQEKFDIEMLKREKVIADMGKKLMIINYTNEFINSKIDRINAGVYYNNKLKVFDRNLGGLYNQYGYMVHPRFKSEPIDIFNLKLTDGNSLFKNSLSCKVNDIDNEDYINLLINEASLNKEILFEEMIQKEIKISYELNSKVSLGTMRFNVIEIDPYISGAYNLDKVEIYTMDSNTASIKVEPTITISNIESIAKTRIILDEKVKFCKVEFTFSVNFESEINHIKIYPFGLKHIHFYEADFAESSFVITQFTTDKFVEYVMNDMVLYTTQGKKAINASQYNIEVYTDYENNTLMGKVNLSSDAAIYRIPKNTKTLFVKIPLIKKDEKTESKEYLCLNGLELNFTTNQEIIL